MNKVEIRKKLRESVLNLERSKTPVQNNQISTKKKANYNSEYADIQHALDSTLLKKSQVMAAAGLGDPDDAGDRKAFNAKLDREPNEEGSIRKFNPKELAAVTKVVSNPAAYLGKKVHHKK